MQMPPTNHDREKGKRPPRGASLALGLGIACLLALALLIGSGSTSAASDPGSAGSSLDADVWLAGWVLAFLALSALYAFDRLQRAAVAGGAAGARPAPGAARGDAERPVETPRRPIEQLLKKKPSEPEKPRPIVVPPPKLNLPEDSPLLRRPNGRDAREEEREEEGESFSVVEPERAAEAALPEPPAAAAETPAPPEPPAAAALPEPPAEPAPPEPPAPPEAPAPPEPSRLERCAALRAEGRFEEAARVAREGLAAEDGDAAPLLVELSRAELGLGHVNAAIDTARDAHFASPSRESISHLIRLLAETRRFSRADGRTLRRAAARHPEHPLLRHAVGVFESMYGEPGAAERELRAALELETDPERRAAIERDLAQVQGRLPG